jgi:hypothetical protein
MKKYFAILTIALAACAAAHAQVAPAANAGPASFGYSLNYAQSAEFGSGQGDWQTAMASGNLHYRSGFERAPFSVSYAGGYTWTIVGPGFSTGYFQHLLGSQALVWRRSSIQVYDDISYLPQAPVTGFSGVPGTGEPIGTPSPSPTSDQTILTLKTRSVDNFLGGSFQEKLSFATSVSATGGWGLLNYPDGNGINIDSYVTTLGLNQRLNARMGLTGSYAYSEFGYPSYNLSFQSNSAFFGFNRTWNRKLSTTVNGGPQWVSSSNSTLIPSSTNFAINGDTRYHWRNLSTGVTYMRGVSGGAGYLLGAHSDVVAFNVSRGFFGRTKLTVGIEGTYRRVAGLNNSGAVSSEDVGIDVNRKLGSRLNAFFGYTVIDQSTNGALPVNVLGNVLQSISFGFGFTPRQSRIIR